MNDSIKKLTKPQIKKRALEIITQLDKDEADFKALRQRVRDLAVGAAGYNFDSPDEWANAIMLSRWIEALRITFECLEQGKNNDYLFKSHNLNEFDNIGTATKFLFDHGVRA